MQDTAGNLRQNIKVSQILPAEWNLVRGAHLLAMLGTLANRLRGHFGGGAHFLAMLGTLGNRLRGHFGGGARLLAVPGTLGNHLRGHFGGGAHLLAVLGTLGNRLRGTLLRRNKTFACHAAWSSLLPKNESVT